MGVVVSCDSRVKSGYDRSDQPPPPPQKPLHRLHIHIIGTSLNLLQTLFHIICNTVAQFPFIVHLLLLPPHFLAFVHTNQKEWSILRLSTMRSISIVALAFLLAINNNILYTNATVLVCGETANYNDASINCTTNPPCPTGKIFNYMCISEVVQFYIHEVVLIYISMYLSSL